MTMTSEVKLEPTAEEIGGHDIEFLAEMRDVLTVGSAAWQRLDMIIAKLETSRAAILAMDRRASPAAEPVAVISRDWQLLWYSPNGIETLSKISERTGAQVGDRLYRASPPAPAVAVKPLEWGSTSYGSPEAYSIIGVYRINDAFDGGWTVVGKNEVIRSADGRSNFATVDLAKAAAQADYEQRIRSALVEPAPAVAISSRDLIKRLGGDPDAPFEVGSFPPEMREPSLCAEPAPAVAVPEDDPECTCCGGTGITYQTERRCACQGPAAAPQPPATRSYEEGIEAAAKWHDGEAAFWEKTRGALDGVPDKKVAAHHRSHATVIRSLADEPRHGE